MSGERPLYRLVDWSDALRIDTQELLTALILEPFGDPIDGLTDCVTTPFIPRLDLSMDCATLLDLIERDWGRAVALDFTSPTETARFWYVSEEKQEPRSGDRHSEPGAERETPLDIARKVQALAADLTGATGAIVAFLAKAPQHRAAARRVQTLDRHPYAEIRDNLIGADCLPIDMLRCKLAFFGAARFDPKSDRSTRITLAQGAPLFDELGAASDAWLPVLADDPVTE